MNNSPAEELRTKAHASFAPELASEIANAITQDELRHLELESVGTLFLANRFYNKLPTGTLRGRLQLVWNAPDRFVFVPDPAHPFSYTTGAGRTITPRQMDTDGGSIPRLLWSSGKFSPWGYAAAFMIHDWVFTAHKCGHAPDTDWEFSQTAPLMAEVMKTLMEVGYTDYDDQLQRLPKKEDTLYLMYQAVNSPIAKKLWNDPSTVNCRPA
jgi:hypothetical protein